MAGKYAKVIDNLPRMRGTDGAYQEKVEVVKDAIKRTFEGASIPATLLATHYEGLRGDEDAFTMMRHDAVEAIIKILGKVGLEAMLSEVNLRLEAYSQLMTDQFEVEGVTSLKLESGRSVGVQYEPYSIVQDKDAFRQWCINNGLEAQMVLPWMTVNSITKERLLAGEPEPAGVVAHARAKVVLRKV